ncbi:MAG: hypothetical protein AB1645_00505 [Bacillota bacterium]
MNSSPRTGGGCAFTPPQPAAGLSTRPVSPANRPSSASLPICRRKGRRSLARGVEEFLRSALRSPGDIERVCRRCGTEHVTSCPLNTIHRELTGRPLTPV